MSRNGTEPGGTADAEGSRKVSVGEIAEMAGVSPSTVSKVINGRPGVAEETRRNVERLLREQDYAKPLVSTKISPTIELVLEYIEHNGTMELVKYATAWAQRAGLALTVTQTGTGVATEEVLRGIIDRNPQGVIMQQMGGFDDTAKELFHSRGIPVVVIDPIEAVDPEVMSVAIDNWTGGYQAGRHLLDLGHRRIAAIRGPMHMQTALARFNGFASALGQAGVPLPDEYVRDGDYFPAETSYEAACALLEMDEPPTAIFCCNDLSAVSTYRAAREHGVALPAGLSVMGFDDVFPASYLMPTLSTIHQPFDEIAQRAVQLIIDARAGRVTDPHVVYPTYLVARDSTVPPMA
ncbi:MAG: LacI family DNA-binding transcriptional regulator [Bifidobacterium sp.]|nr:LacI family DNA-binding transcriptional regulator [Bifidobacterium sp.]